MVKVRGSGFLFAIRWSARARKKSETKTRGWWYLFLSLVFAVMGVGISSAFAATIGPAYPVVPQVGTVFNGKIIVRIVDGRIETVYDETYDHDSMLAAWPDRGFPLAPPDYQSRFQGNPCWRGICYGGDGPLLPILV